MEFPELGTHCTVSSCNRLDFLPFECDACQKIFCKDHRTYEQHNCTEAYDKNTVVPTCPLCNQPVPVSRGEDPNIKVENHIQQECQSEKAKKLYTNRCSFPGCKKKELVPVICNTCRQNFCLKHRFETSHNCQGPQRASRNKPVKATGVVRPKPSSATPRQPQSTALTQIGAELHRERVQRQQQKQQSQRSPPSHNPSGMGEDEALRLAIAASLSDQPQSAATAEPQHTQDHTHQPNCDEDEALARAIAASLNEERPKPKSKPPPPAQRQNSRSSDCTVS